MFGNLVESGSHAGDLQRKGSFFMGTLGVYAVLFVCGGVASIYAYDARLKVDEFEVAMMLPPPDAAPPEIARPEPRRPQNQQPAAQNDRPTPQVVTDAFADANNSVAVPKQTSVIAHNIPPVTDRNFVTGPRDIPASGPGGGKDGNGTGANVLSDAQLAAPPPLPPTPRPIQTPAPSNIVRSVGVIESKAVSKPAPPYPPLARTTHVQGPVTVQITVDETGRVISARALSGHPLLTQAAVRAALQARFTPTYLSSQPIKVSGMITYNFVLQ